MKPKDVVSYLVGADYIKKHLDFQERVLVENTGQKGPHFPLDGDLKTAGRVYRARVRAMYEYPVVIASRVTGVDLALKKVREQLAKESNK